MIVQLALAGRLVGLLLLGLSAILALVAGYSGVAWLAGGDVAERAAFFSLLGGVGVGAAAGLLLLLAGLLPSCKAV